MSHSFASIPMNELSTATGGQCRCGAGSTPSLFEKLPQLTTTPMPQKPATKPTPSVSPLARYPQGWNPARDGFSLR